MEKATSKKIFGIIEGVVIIALGVLVAIFGIRTLNLYFGILFVVAAAAFLVIGLVEIIKLKRLSFTSCLGFAAFLVLGISILAYYLNFEFIVEIVSLLVIAVGGALIFFGVYTAIVFNVFYGVGQIVLGALAATMGILYITVPGFRTAFWIVVGILIALYGVIYLIEAIAGKKLIKSANAE